MTTTASAQVTPYKIQFSGATWLGLGQTGTVTVNVSGGPSSTFNYSAMLSGTNTTGGGVTPTYGVASGSFSLSVTAPSTAQNLILTVNVTSGGSVGSAQYHIRVIEPVTIKATVVNLGNMTVSNVPIAFVVDDRVLNTTTLTINGKSNKTVSFDWLDPNIAAGTHKVTIRLDPNNTFIKFPNGSTEYTTTIFIGDSGMGIINLFLAVTLGILLFFAFITYMNRGKKKRRR